MGECAALRWVPLGEEIGLATGVGVFMLGNVEGSGRDHTCWCPGSCRLWKRRRVRRRVLVENLNSSEAPSVARSTAQATHGSESEGNRLNSRCAAGGISNTERLRVLRMQRRLAHRKCVSVALGCRRRHHRPRGWGK